MTVTKIKRKYGKPPGLPLGKNTWARNQPRFVDGSFMSIEDFQKLKKEGKI